MVADFEAVVELYHRPYRLEVRTPQEWWGCHNCGDAFDLGEAPALMVLADGSNDLCEDVTFCFGCVRSMVPRVPDLTSQSYQ